MRDGGRPSPGELAEKILERQKSFYPPLLLTIRIELEHRRRPVRVVFLPVALESVRIVFDVHPRGQKVLIHEADDTFVRPHLGIQPSTAPSHRRGAEIQEDGLVLLLCFLEDLVYIVAELDFHGGNS